MIIVDQGGIVEFCADAGEFVYDSSHRTQSILHCGKMQRERLENTFSILENVYLWW